MGSYFLVEQEVNKCLSSARKEDIDTAINEIVYRIDKNDTSIDIDFMTEFIKRQRSDIVLSFRTTLPVSDQKTKVSTTSSKDDALLSELKRAPLGEGEEVFESRGEDFEQSRPQQGFVGSSKLRKPVFYNTVHYGVVWTKYAQAHYGEKTPPPRQVFGFKFNIVYSDLINPAVAPKYKVEPSKEEGSLLLRFTAGAPYDDLVFRIPNKQWDFDRRSGFTCTFERGILKLHFSFMRDRYRR
jgi:hypothetical protein